MEVLESTKLTIELLEDGKEKLTKQSIGNVTADPEPEKLLQLGEIMKDLAPEKTAFDSILKTEQTRYYKS